MPDIEDTPKLCPKTREPCAGKCHSSNGHSDKKSVVSKQATPEGEWYMPENLDQLCAVLNQLPQGAKYRLVAGNTGTGKEAFMNDVLNECYSTKTCFYIIYLFNYLFGAKKADRFTVVF